MHNALTRPPACRRQLRAWGLSLCISLEQMPRLGFLGSKRKQVQLEQLLPNGFLKEVY